MPDYRSLEQRLFEVLRLEGRPVAVTFQPVLPRPHTSRKSIGLPLSASLKGLPILLIYSFS